MFCKFSQAAIVITSLLVILTGCNYNNEFAGHAVAKEPAKVSTWLVYWDLEAGENDLRKIGNELDKLSYFGAYFDKNDHVFIPKELGDKREELRRKKERYETYLTFVNDKENPDGTSVLKDTDVLRRLFSNDASMEKHIDEILKLTLQGGYDGIEIDYERIWQNKKIGQSFVRFIEKLYGKALQHHLKLRVVLEPSTPFSAAGLPRGPEYVVMFYNLYGLHSGPGPKANKEFILKTLTQMEALPGEKSAAFATGGCEWSSNGEKRLLTEVEAKKLATTYGAKASRDEASQCLVFHYKDALGISHQVWYADAKTLKFWMSIAAGRGVNNISLWCLGGNVDINKVK
ncbi:glycosyl hydrolase family 18 protein [Lucifera butyrica]|nr:glycosyl hydrolase family 18 protein [Lucifera butyrica]